MIIDSKAVINELTRNRILPNNVTIINQDSLRIIKYFIKSHDNLYNYYLIKWKDTSLCISLNANIYNKILKNNKDNRYNNVSFIKSAISHQISIVNQKINALSHIEEPLLKKIIKSIYNQSNTYYEMDSVSLNQHFSSINYKKSVSDSIYFSNLRKVLVNKIEKGGVIFGNNDFYLIYKIINNQVLCEIYFNERQFIQDK